MKLGTKKEIFMIEELTKEQDEKLDEYFEKWSNVGLRFGKTTPEDREISERAIFEIYKEQGLSQPQVFWARSPEEAIKKLFELGDDKIKSEPLGDVGFGQHDASWLSFYDFFGKEAGLEDEVKDLKNHMILAGHCGWWWPYENACMLSEIPISLSMDANGNLSNMNGPAVEYSDGFSVYCIDGINVPEWVITTPASEIDPKEILKIENVDSRRVAIKKIGIQKMITKIGAKTIDSKEFTIGGKYVLLSIDYTGSNRIYLQMKNPSIDDTHVEAVHPDCQTVDQALGFRRYGMTNTEWRKKGYVYETPKIIS